MKKIILFIVLSSFEFVSAQFKIDIKASDTFADKKVLIYSLNGSKDLLIVQVDKKNGKWKIDFPEYYKGMLRAYFPETAQSITFISENRDIDMALYTDGKKIVRIDYSDEANKNWNETIGLERKKEEILPVLSQIKTFYNDKTSFDIALDNEINRLREAQSNVEEGSFLKYYLEHSKYTYREEEKGSLKDTYRQILINSGDMLESSSLMKPILINFLRSFSREDLFKEVDSLLDELNLETPRGQTVLAELLSIFEVYGLEVEKQRYYEKASALTCSINKNLEINLDGIKSTSIGAVFKEYIFTSRVTNTRLKKLSDIKAHKKVVLFWSSTCPHCLSELPIILEKYNELKNKGIEVIALSLDTDEKSYKEKTGVLPWINDTELKGWKSNFVEKYNVHATPTYYILDSKNRIIEKPRNFSVFLSSIGIK